MNEKLVGYALLVVGVSIVLLPAYNVYQVFEKEKQVIEFFSFEGVSVDITSGFVNQLDPALKSQLVESEPEKTEIVSADQINKPLNLFTHVFFMGFFLNVGYKIAMLGVELLRTVTVDISKIKTSPSA
jgi:hypothetical protein